MTGGYWIIVTLCCIFVQSVYSMCEMAMVSFNKVRLQYWVDKGVRRARWIDRLVSNPAYLFGTTLLLINIALQVGSQCAREAYAAFNLDPDIAPWTQVFLVLIFAELAPMFAARRYAEAVAMLGAPLIYLTSIVVRPIIWLIQLISDGANWCVGGGRGKMMTVLSREELQHMVAPSKSRSEGELFDELITNIFNFRQKVASDLMTPLAQLNLVPQGSQVRRARSILERLDLDALPLYYNSRKNIVAIAFAKDLVEAKDEEKLATYARAPWFVSAATPASQILSQFRYNGQASAIALDDEGQAVGLLTLDDLVNALFKKTRHTKRVARQPVVTLTLPATMPVTEFNQKFDTNFPDRGNATIGKLVSKRLSSPVEVGDTVVLGNYRFTVAASSMFGIKSLTVKTVD